MTYDAFIKDYERKGLLKKQEIDSKDLVKIVTRSFRELEIAKATLAIDEGVAFTIVYTAMLHAGRALMLSKGYRPMDGYQHKTVIDFAGIVLGKEYKGLIEYFDMMRKKRNIFTYELSISFSESEVINSLETAKRFIVAVKSVIEEINPQLKFNI